MNSFLAPSLVAYHAGSILARIGCSCSAFNQWLEQSMVSKTVHYRRFETPDKSDDGNTLQALLIRCLSTKAPSGKTILDDFDARTFPFPNDHQFQWLIHAIEASDESVFGALLLFCPDTYVPVIARQEKATDEHKTLAETLAELEIAERPPLAGESFLAGIAYWYVVGNHMFIVQHVSLQTKAFELYFGQLFSAAGVADKNSKFGLTSVFDRGIVGGDLQEVSAVEIGGVMPRFSPEARAAAAELVSREIKTEKEVGVQRVALFDKAKEILVACLGSANAEKIMLQMPADAELQVDVRFGYRTRKRSVSRAALLELAQAARNLPDGEVRAIGRDGKQIGSDLRLSTPMPFEMVRARGSLIKLDSAKAQLQRVYQRFVEDKKIDP
ncbi:hypothetical protein [Roseomonas xinghualingensis]|uniref:hypothetical protein n=1 Tax=Roseomonas xinghualingensis TaxID=2986475 RepID=UPI0021F1DF78|nr:hypothetical protein [Roseomonas sp. SXEYE001]MCV4209030.1 hypothetical protein [Roseomonas sp. SXEYE001]